MDDQNYSIEFFVSFPTIYHYNVCDDGKVPAKIVLLYGGKSSYSSFLCVCFVFLEISGVFAFPELLRTGWANRFDPSRSRRVLVVWQCV